ncbi:hypothetical protein FBZ94_101193 [Bradyrhizobium sacchari]|uniref:Uncharacterized protein n=1 Tax=Bradyrhizobium sacchari TaxID=1399419 RepID=A0A560JDN2_9BRAD|nr:hypothetical protein FBZ94_101193 [Bradyrhizobium sacchari]TWB83757.1 hypothetical protein FBZ95_101193 [Bradyrhizobium sacchari]
MRFGPAAIVRISAIVLCLLIGLAAPAHAEDEPALEAQPCPLSVIVSVASWLPPSS